MDLIREQLDALESDVAAAGDCVVWRKELAIELLDAAQLLEESRSENELQARRMRYLERRIVELESDLSVARAGVPRSP